MTLVPGLVDLARALLERSTYMTIATADADGRPWASPVWFAWDRRRTLWWVSRPEAVHSGNIAVRPDIGIVVFDTAAVVGQAQAVYLSATARRDDDPAGLEVFSRKAVASGLKAWSPADVAGPSELRLYRADIEHASVLAATVGHGRDERFPVDLS